MQLRPIADAAELRLHVEYCDTHRPHEDEDGDAVVDCACIVNYLGAYMRREYGKRPVHEWDGGTQIAGFEVN